MARRQRASGGGEAGYRGAVRGSGSEKHLSSSGRQAVGGALPGALSFLIRAVEPDLWASRHQNCGGLRKQKRGTSESSRGETAGLHGEPFVSGPRGPRL